MITIVKEDDGFQVWTDCEGGQKDGRCIGCHEKASTAVMDAIVELESDLKEARRAFAAYSDKGL